MAGLLGRIGVGVVLSAAAVCVGCSVEEPGGPCSSSRDCAADELCLDGRCSARTMDAGGSDAGEAVDAGGAHDGGEALDAPEDASCGGAGIGVTGTPPAVLVVFDRSCSMRRRVDDPTQFASGPEDPQSRWYVAREAVRRIVDRFPTRVNWGLATFPGVLQGCDATPPVAVEPAPGVGAAVMAELSRAEVEPFTYCTPPGSTTPGLQPHQTPTGDALRAAQGVAALADSTRDRFVLLLTDGGASCGETEASLGAMAAALRDAGAPVIVVGFSEEADSATAGPLNEAIASNGGLPRPGGPPSYFYADTAAALEALLDELVAATLPCTFALSEAPPDPSLLRVTANDVPLAEDPADGWTYDAATTSLTLHGAACAAVRDGTTTRINAAYGCPVPPCTPVAETCDGLDNDCDGEVDDGCLM